MRPLLLESGVEGYGRGLEVYALDEAERLGGAVLAVHAAVLPLDRERALVVYTVEGADDLLEVDLAAAHAAEIPISVHVAEGEVPAEDTRRHRLVGPPYILHVYVEYAVGKGVDELHVIDTLVSEVARVVVEAEGGVVVYGLEGALGRRDVECDLGGVGLKGESYAHLLVSVEYGTEAACELVESGLHVILRYGREGVQHVPDGASGEAYDRIHAQHLGRLAQPDHLGRGALAHPFGVAVTPDARREDILVAAVDRVAYALPEWVVRYGIEFEPVSLHRRAYAVAMLLTQRVEVEVVVVAGQFESVVSHLGSLAADGLKAHVGPLCRV